MQWQRLIAFAVLVSLFFSTQSSSLVEVAEAETEVAEEQQIEQETYHDVSPFEEMFGPTLYAWSKENPEQAEQRLTAELLAVSFVTFAYCILNCPTYELILHAFNVI